MSTKRLTGVTDAGLCQVLIWPSGGSAIDSQSWDLNPRLKYPLCLGHWEHFKDTISHLSFFVFETGSH